MAVQVLNTNSELFPHPKIPIVLHSEVFPFKSLMFVRGEFPHKALSIYDRVVANYETYLELGNFHIENDIGFYLFTVGIAPNGGIYFDKRWCLDRNCSDDSEYIIPVDDDEFGYILSRFVWVYSNCVLNISREMGESIVMNIEYGKHDLIDPVHMTMSVSMFPYYDEPKIIYDGEFFVHKSITDRISFRDVCLPMSLYIVTRGGIEYGRTFN